MSLSARFGSALKALRGREESRPDQGGASAVPARTEDTPTADPHPAKVFRPVIVLIVVLGVALLGLFALKRTAQPPSRLAVFSATAMLAAAATAVGASSDSCSASQGACRNRDRWPAARRPRPPTSVVSMGSTPTLSRSLTG